MTPKTDVDLLSHTWAHKFINTDTREEIRSLRTITRKLRGHHKEIKRVHISHANGHARSVSVH